MKPPAAKKPSGAPLSEAEIDELADLVDVVDERTEVPLSLEGLDGFVTALACGPRPVSTDECLPVMLDRVEGLAGVFDDRAAEARFRELFERRRQAIEAALAAPVENLADPHALSPLLMDWEGLLAALPKSDAARLTAEGVPLHAQLWASAFLLAVEYWEDEWSLPEGSEDEAFVDERLEPFYVLMAPEDELSPEERAASRDELLAQAIWGAYDLCEFWRDRGHRGGRLN